MIRILSLTIIVSFILSSCGRPFPLIEANKEVQDFALKIADTCFYGSSKGEDITENLSSFKDLLDSTFQGELTPQIKSGTLKLIDDPGLGLDSYPVDDNLPGAIVARPIQASLSLFTQALLHDDQVAVYGPLRYISHEREYDEGAPQDFIIGDIDFISYSNHVVDVGQMDISFEYETYTELKRYKSDNLPDGVLVLCDQMKGEATRVEGGFNAYLKRLHSFNIYIPESKDRTYMVVGSWTEAGGGLWVFGSSANSGNIGEGIITEMEGISEWLYANQ